MKYLVEMPITKSKRKTKVNAYNEIQNRNKCILTTATENVVKLGLWNDSARPSFESDSET